MAEGGAWLPHRGTPDGGTSHNSGETVRATELPARSAAPEHTGVASEVVEAPPSVWVPSHASPPAGATISAGKKVYFVGDKRPRPTAADELVSEHRQEQPMQSVGSGVDTRAQGPTITAVAVGSGLRMEDGQGGQGERQRGVNGDMPYASTPSAAAPAVSAGETVRLDDGSKAEYAELQGVVSHGNTVDEGGEPAKVDATADMEAWLLEAIEAEKENTESEEEPGPSVPGGNVRALHSGELREESESRPAVLRILVVVCGCASDQPQSYGNGCGGLYELSELDKAGNEDVAQIHFVWSPTLQSLSQAVCDLSPTLVYFVAPATGDGGDLKLGALHVTDDSGEAASVGEIFDAICLSRDTVQGVYFDATVSTEAAWDLRGRGIPYVICWVGLNTEYETENLGLAANALYRPTAATASCFSRAFFGALLATTGVDLLEAFTMAAKAAEVYSPLEETGPVGPGILSDREAYCLPDHTSVQPPPHFPVDLAGGVEAAIPGWQYARLIAPQIQLKLVLVGSPEAEELHPERLATLARMLRSLLVMDVRECSVLGCSDAPTHSHLGDRLPCRDCQVATSSGASFHVQLGAPAGMLDDEWAVQYTLATTLALGAMQLRFRLPGSGYPVAGTLSLNHTLTSNAIEIPAAEVLCTTSVWVARVLHQYASTLAMPGKTLLRLGIIQVGSQPVKAMSGMDLDHLKAVLSPPEPGVQPSAPVTQLANYGSKRPALLSCSKDGFIQDLVLFYERVLHECLVIEKLPILNGSPLDLFNLYVEVCKRGGFECKTGINWKGQVFRKMSNYTEDNKQTGVGNALKKHYSTFLETYEKHHPADVASGICSLCGHGQGSRPDMTDWIACHVCDNWFHYACDHRASLVSYNQYSRDGGAEYTCPSCAT